jgi:rod shape-determining protein MreD
MDPRWALPVFANFLLLFLSGQINHYLAPLPLSIFVAGLCLPIAGLRLRFQPGLLAMLLTGLLCDASRPVPFGSSALLLGGLFTVWHGYRSRLPREGIRSAVTGALLANLVLFIAQPFLVGASLAAASATAGRVFVDFLASQVAVVLLGPWFFALQERALLLWGVNLAEEARAPGGAL